MSLARPSITRRTGETAATTARKAQGRSYAMAMGILFCLRQAAIIPPIVVAVVSLPSSLSLVSSWSASESALWAPLEHSSHYESEKQHQHQESRFLTTFSSSSSPITPTCGHELSIDFADDPKDSQSDERPFRLAIQTRRRRRGEPNALFYPPQVQMVVEARPERPTTRIHPKEATTSTPDTGPFRAVICKDHATNTSWLRTNKARWETITVAFEAATPVTIDSLQVHLSPEYKEEFTVIRYYRNHGDDVPFFVENLGPTSTETTDAQTGEMVVRTVTTRVSQVSFFTIGLFQWGAVNANDICILPSKDLKAVTVPTTPFRQTTKQRQRLAPLMHKKRWLETQEEEEDDAPSIAPSVSPAPTGLQEEALGRVFTICESVADVECRVCSDTKVDACVNGMLLIGSVVVLNVLCLGCAILSCLCMRVQLRRLQPEAAAAAGAAAVAAARSNRAAAAAAAARGVAGGNNSDPVNRVLADAADASGAGVAAYAEQAPPPAANPPPPTMQAPPNHTSPSLPSHFHFHRQQQ